MARGLLPGGIMKRGLALAALVLLASQSTACMMSPRTASGLARAAILTTVVAANIAIVASHDAHYHAYGCGHHHRWRDGRAVYYYGGHWEYYDHHGGVWYRYVD
jgi:hypothetical protein